jgi:hypothetical protein
MVYLFRSYRNTDKGFKMGAAEVEMYLNCSALTALKSQLISAEI